MKNDELIKFLTELLTLENKCCECPGTVDMLENKIKELSEDGEN